MTKIHRDLCRSFASHQHHQQHLMKKKYFSEFNWFGKACILPSTSEFEVEVLNQESSPYFPGLYLDVRKSLGNPHTTDTKWGRDLFAPAAVTLADSISVENPLRKAREITLDVQLSECIFSFVCVYLVLQWFTCASRNEAVPLCLPGTSQSKKNHFSRAPIFDVT